VTEVVGVQRFRAASVIIVLIMVAVELWDKLSEAITTLKKSISANELQSFCDEKRLLNT
jgi:hypothetical protein